MSGGTFRKVDAGGGESFGPPALLLCGFAANEVEPVGELLRKVGVDGHRPILCTKPMVRQPLGEALAAAGSEDPPAPPESLPRVMVLSGMTGPQIRAFLQGFGQTGLPRPIFASTTPHNLGILVRDLLVELLREHQEMAKQR